MTTSSLPSAPSAAPGFWLTRIVFLRAIFAIFSVAFLVAMFQNDALIGDEGLTPAKRFWAKIKVRYGRGGGKHAAAPTTSPAHHSVGNTAELLHPPPEAQAAGHSLFNNFCSYPSLFWLLGDPSTASLQWLSRLGLALSLFICVTGTANMLLVFAVWLIYFTICSVGQVWYGFGWESQLLETAFLCMFIVPFTSLSSFPTNCPLPWVGIWGYRWLLFRIMMGAGLIKIRGDQCWRDLTAMHYHYQTQPVPNPLSAFYHFLPNWWHNFEVLSNHIIELVAPILLLSPWRVPRAIGAGIQILFQLVLISSGNLSFLNWLTLIPAVLCLDDGYLGFLFSPAYRARAIEAEAAYMSAVQQGNNAYIHIRLGMYLLVGLLIVWLSVPVVTNLLSPRQRMNASFSSFRIINSYGAFGSITRKRNEVIILGTTDDAVNTDTVWVPFEFHVKPGDINRISKFISPYHYRLDWLMWFAAMQSYQQVPWLLHLSYKLLRQDKLATGLLEHNPFASGKPAPTFIKADLYEYQYTQPCQRDKKKDDDAEQGWEVGRYWQRRFVQNFFPPISRDNPSAAEFLRNNNLLD